jgi:WNK lysine deficient protein kinase
MCVLEMCTGRPPYSECRNPGTIYKKITLHELPADYHRILDVEVKEFITLCLEPQERRPTADELLQHPFLLESDS